MNNCLILGFGRSGTSMLGGILSRSSYYTGENSYAPRHSNPLGFFEDARINGINERILEKFDHASPGEAAVAGGKPYSPFHPRYGHRWLSFIDPSVKISCSDPEILTTIRTVLQAREPFAFKDPRFSYTLDVWRQFLAPGTKFICLFREPSTVVNSVLEECATADYLHELFIDKPLVYRLWENCYRRILRQFYPSTGINMTFVSYDHFLRYDHSEALSEFLDARIRIDFMDQKLDRSRPDETCPGNVMKLYQELLELSLKPLHT